MGKTGSALRNEKWVSGWFVGCVNKDGRYYVFATNIEAADGANGGKAREITKSILKEMGYFVTALAKRHIRNKTGSPLKGSGSRWL